MRMSKDHYFINETAQLTMSYIINHRSYYSLKLVSTISFTFIQIWTWHFVYKFKKVGKINWAWKHALLSQTLKTRSFVRYILLIFTWGIWLVTLPFASLDKNANELNIKGKVIFIVQICTKSILKSLCYNYINPRTSILSVL